MSYEEVLERIYKSLIKIVIKKVPIQYKISIKKDYYSYLKRKYVESDFIINGNIESLILRYVDYETFIVNSYDVNNFLSEIIYDSNLIEFDREIFKNEYVNTLIDLQYIALNTKYKSLRIK